jgi:tRNA-dihydrouridine synthase B
MIGRAAQGNPWLFAQVSHFLNSGELLEKPSMNDIHDVLMIHLEKLYSFYGAGTGVRLARKHISWYFRALESVDSALKSQINQTLEPKEQLRLVSLAMGIMDS